MKIIIVGCGKVGYAIANQMALEKHDVVMVDGSAAALQKADSSLDIMCVEGNGASISVLKKDGTTLQTKGGVYQIKVVAGGTPVIFTADSSNSFGGISTECPIQITE